MISDGKKWHYHTVKKLFVLLRGITSKHDRDFFFCIKIFHSYSTKKEKKLRSIIMYVKTIIIAT